MSDDEKASVRRAEPRSTVGRYLDRKEVKIVLLLARGGRLWLRAGALWLLIGPQGSRERVTYALARRIIEKGWATPDGDPTPEGRRVGLSLDPNGKDTGEIIRCLHCDLPHWDTINPECRGYEPRTLYNYGTGQEE